MRTLPGLRLLPQVVSLLILELSVAPGRISNNASIVLQSSHAAWRLKGLLRVDMSLSVHAEAVTRGGVQRAELPNDQFRT